jgi:signal transduction histidine kinase
LRDPAAGRIIRHARRTGAQNTMKRTRSISILRSGWMALAVVILVAAFVLADWYYYAKTRRSLDEEFGRRLAAIAELASSEVSRFAAAPARDLLSGAPAADSARAGLERIRDRHSLFNVVVLRDDYVTLLSLEPALYPEDAEYPHWQADYLALERAFRGEVAATDLYGEKGAYLKAGYAPLPPGGTAADAVVGVEASAEFLGALARLRLILVAVTAISAAGIVLFAVFALRAASSLAAARESLARAESLAAMGRMAAGIAHEIRHPLFIIRRAAEKLRAKHPESAPDVESYVIEEVDRLNGILTDYLLFARDEPARRVPMDLVATLDRCARNLRESGGEDPVAVETRFERAEAPFVGEEKRIEQAFLNILLNARQAAPAGGAISVSLAIEGGRYRACVADTGAGIAPKDLDRIFEPFFTTKSKGSGLGLAITKKIVEAHGGEITVESAPGAGTVVSVFLPAPAGTNGPAGGRDGA